MFLCCQCCRDLRPENGYTPAITLVSVVPGVLEPMCDSCADSMYDVNEELGNEPPTERMIPMEFEDDVPPAGTACSTCKDCGHFCPAKRWIKDTDVALCQPCYEERDCAVFAAQRYSKGNLGDMDETPVLPMPAARIVPRSEWKESDLTITEKAIDLADVPFGIRKQVKDELRAKISAGAVKQVPERSSNPPVKPAPEGVVKTVEKSLAPNAPQIIPATKSVDARDMVLSLNDILAGVISGSVKVDQANAACQIVHTMLKCVEVDWRMNQVQK